MTIEIYIFRRIDLRKILGYVCLGVIILGIGSMVKGPVGSNESLYSRYDAPVWVYIITIVGVLVAAIFYLDSIFSPLKPVGSVEVRADELRIKIRNEEICIPYSQIKALSIQLEYHYDKVCPDKNNRRLYIKTTEYEKTLEVVMDDVQEKKVKEKIKDVGLSDK